MTPSGLNVGGITLSNPGDITAATNAANNAATSAYQMAIAQAQTEQVAINRAAEKWNEVYQGALLSGTYNGKPTESASEFQQTSTGYTADHTPTLEREISQNNATISLLNTLAGLRGPQNAFQYARVLNGTPQGLVDIVNAASGRLGISSFGGGAQPNYTGQGSAAGPVQPAAVSAPPAAPAAPPVAAPAQGMLPTRTVQTAPPAGTPLTPRIAPGGQVDMGQATLGTLVGDVNNPAGARPPETSPLPLPNQIDPIAWSRYSPTQKSLLLADYQDQGWDPLDVDALRKASLSQYGAPRRGSVQGLFAA